jgi:membrane-associated phospholipid phosphatase
MKNARGRHPRRAAASVLALAMVLSLGAGEARADSVQAAGDVGAILLPAAAAAGALVAKDYRGLGQLTLAYTSTMSVVYILKPLVDRTRPNGGSQSFPSGHAASAFAGAAFVQMRYGWKLGLPAYAVATFVAYSRVESKNHYTSDVVAGGAIGIGANLVFTRRRKKVAVSLDAGQGHAAASVRMAW